MSSFLEDITPFNGTGEVNVEGQDLKTFLENYDASQYESPSVTADILVFKHKKHLFQVNSGLQLLMVKRKDHPCIGNWALPGGFVENQEDLEEAAKRELKEETNLEGIPLQQLHTWGEVWRDPRSRIITTSFLALVSDEVLEVKAGDDAAEALWFQVSLELMENKEIIIRNERKLSKSYRLSLVAVEDENDLTLSATVTQVADKEGLLKEEIFKVESSNGIAFDHPRFILQALLYTQNLLNTRNLW